MVGDNPAYEQVNAQKIMLKESPVYHTVHPAATSADYEELPQFRGLGECGREEDNPVYEDVSKI